MADFFHHRTRVRHAVRQTAEACSGRARCAWTRAKDGDKLLRGEWVIDQQEWQWVSEDIEDLDPKQF
ncbi:hypothetical protein QF037_009621 [Streptomyces canus]|uniref:hypothetical protein n=1 Tax=Streptomyces canus TaxID=58343 RepID=UPI002783568A|nr:hypothetical protein [Streptomyces canus]MDQ0605276.1 hypothetical protein [Streptomyces canus]